MTSDPALGLVTSVWRDGDNGLGSQVESDAFRFLARA